MSTRTEDTIYGFHSTAGWDFMDFTKTPQTIFTIWDAGGIDTIDASGFNQDQTIDLTPRAIFEYWRPHSEYRHCLWRHH